MRKILLSSAILIASIYSYTGNINSTYAATGMSEEEYCFEILSNQTDAQFWVELDEIKLRESDNFTVDISTYSKFKNYTLDNWNQHYLIGFGDFFAAKRNNIATIQANGDYILSQFVPFGDRTNFTFPLRSSTGGYVQWESWNNHSRDFRRNIVYTHHLLDWTFVSCSYLKVTPRGTHDYNDISQSDYKTNIFETSGFEVVDNSVTKWGSGEYEFMIGKARVGSIDYDDNPLFTLDIVTIIYNNKSSYFNEFEIFPQQIQAMTNSDSTYGTGWARLFKVQEDFLNRVYNNTCLELIHPTTADLPASCGGTFKSLSYKQTKSIIASILDSIIPKALAKIEPVEWYKEKMEAARGMVIYDGFPYELSLKLNKITDPSFRTYLQIALVPNFEEYIEDKKAKHIVLSPFETSFLKCNIPLHERVKIVSDLMKKIEDPTKIDYKNLEYLDPKFGECIIPYQDKRNAGKTTNDSFPWYKTLADINAGIYTGAVDNVDFDTLQSLVNKRNDLQAQYVWKILALQKSIENKTFSGHILDVEKQITEEKQKMDAEMQKMDAEINKAMQALKDGKKIVSSETEMNLPILKWEYKKYAMIGFLVLGVLFIGFGIFSRRKRQ